MLDALQAFACVAVRVVLMPPLLALLFCDFHRIPEKYPVPQNPGNQLGRGVAGRVKVNCALILCLFASVRNCRLSRIEPDNLYLVFTQSLHKARVYPLTDTLRVVDTTCIPTHRRNTMSKTNRNTRVTTFVAWAHENCMGGVYRSPYTSPAMVGAITMAGQVGWTNRFVIDCFPGDRVVLRRAAKGSPWTMTGKA